VGGSVVTPNYSQVKWTRKVKPLPNVDKGKTHTHTHTYIYIYIYMKKQERKKGKKTEK